VEREEELVAMTEKTYTYLRQPHYSMHHPGHQSYYSMPSVEHTSAFAHGAPGFAAFFIGLMFLSLIIFCLFIVAQRLRSTQVYMSNSLRQSEPQLYTATHTYQQGYQALHKKQLDPPGNDYPQEWQQYEAPQVSYPEMPRQRS
jgi:hypothetical protein